MPAQPDKLLIVCFSFPPVPGIGGRRWAKFAKYLAQNNFTVHALSSKNYSGFLSEWTKDVSNSKIVNHTFELGASKVLSFYPKNFFQKITYKYLWNISPFLIKGNPQDKVYFIREKLLQQTKDIIQKNNISTVIVTIPPYKLAYHLLGLKKQFPDVKFIVDYRDPWTDNKSFHGFHNLEDKRLKQELDYETEVLNTYDVVLDVNDESLEHLKEKISNKNKFYHLPNGLDSEDYQRYKPTNSTGDKIRFVFSGSFYPNLIYLLKPFLNCIKQIKEQRPDIYSKLEFNFYGNMDHNAQQLIKESAISVVKFHGNIPQSDILPIIAGSDICMLFSAIDHGSAFNTKFYEAMYFRKPIVSFGPEGKLSDFIINNNVGITLTDKDLSSNGTNQLLDLVKGTRTFDTTFDISSFEIKNITAQLINIIHAK